MVYVEFKSTPENYKKEYYGQKNNTVRFLEPSEDRDVILRMAATHPFLHYLHIRIRNTETNNYFERVVKDITFYKHKGVPELTIITWEHDNSHEIKS